MKYPKKIDIPIEQVERVTSTNDYMAYLCTEGRAQEFHTVVAKCQTEGRGQRGNSWESEAGKNLIFSTVLYPTVLEAKKQFYLSMLVAISVVDALGKYIDGFCIKWPNDIYWKDKKIAGILIENELQGKYIIRSIIGVGLNVNQEVFLSDAPNPISLKQIVGATINREELLIKILHGIVAGYRLLEENFDRMSDTLNMLYQRSLYRRNGYYPYRDATGIFNAQFDSLEPDGHIRLQDEQGKCRRYTFKEVEYIL